MDVLGAYLPPLRRQMSYTIKYKITQLLRGPADER